MQPQDAASPLQLAEHMLAEQRAVALHPSGGRRGGNGSRSPASEVRAVRWQSCHERVLSRPIFTPCCLKAVFPGLCWNSQCLDPAI